MRRLMAAMAMGFGVALAAVPATAQTFGFWLDNDLFAGEDRYYTNGIQLYYITPERPVFGAVDWLADPLLVPEPQFSRRYGFAVGQKMFTPADLARNPPSPEDRPYAGWLYARASMLTETPRVADRFELDVGVVGPWSLAEDTQKFVHRVVPGSTYPRGWGHQIENEPGIVVSAERAWRQQQPWTLGPLDADLTPHLGGSLGNVFTHIGGGATLRLGGNMPPAVGSPVVRPITPIPYQDAVGAGFSWYLYASAEGRLVARNIFLDGNTFRDSASVDKIPAVGTVQLGVTMKWENVSLTAAYNVTTPEFTEQKGLGRYGTVRLAVTY